MILGVGTFSIASVVVSNLTKSNVYTYEIIPKAWYSLTALLLMRPNSPCCIPRSKRRTATLFEGCRKTTEWNRSVLAIRETHKLNVDRNLSCTDPRKNDPRCHAHHIPEILLPDDMHATQVPLLPIGIPEIPQKDEHPYRLRERLTIDGRM